MRRVGYVGRFREDSLSQLNQARAGECSVVQYCQGCTPHLVTLDARAGESARVLSGDGEAIARGFQHGARRSA